jgi:hypothetical protein
MTVSDGEWFEANPHRQLRLRPSGESDLMGKVVQMVIVDRQDGSETGFWIGETLPCSDSDAALASLRSKLGRAGPRYEPKQKPYFTPWCRNDAGQNTPSQPASRSNDGCRLATPLRPQPSRVPAQLPLRQGEARLRQARRRRSSRLRLCS